MLRSHEKSRSTISLKKSDLNTQEGWQGCVTQRHVAPNRFLDLTDFALDSNYDFEEHVAWSGRVNAKKYEYTYEYE